MKKLIYIVLTTLLLVSCTYEDETVDPTVMPPATTIGANTFGCLIDGWLYVGGRYWDYEVKEGTHHPLSFVYNEEEQLFTAEVRVGAYQTITFKIEHPVSGKQSPLTDFYFDDQKLEDGKVLITHFDTRKKIISGTFGNDGQLTHGRFDTTYRQLK
ncbi:MAG: hypothetical protein EOM31_10220 [Bacteroidia bacterium]|nr:hypothetical protein [Bacteroidia bacterium]